MRTYLFYDIETSGLNHCFDQILQFAAIRTDEQLLPLEQYNLRIRLLPDVVPSPGALTTCRVSVDDIQAGYDEYTALRQIHAWLNAPGTTSLGYNTLHFDDLFLRFSFYRNLLPVYTHQWKDGCARADLYPLMALYYLQRPQQFIWPERNGKLSLKLEDLAAANAPDDGQAHDALVDVAATVRLARRMAQDTELWHTAFKLFDKNYDVENLNRLPARRLGHTTYPLALLVEGSLGARAAFRAPALLLNGPQAAGKSTVWLRLDRMELRNLTPDQPVSGLFTYKKLGELPLALRLEGGQLSAERHALVEDNLAWLAAHPHALEALVEQHAVADYTPQADLDAYGALYQIGFPDRREEALLSAFHAAPWPNKAAIIPQLRAPYQELARRLVGNHAPHVLPTHEARQYQAYLARIWNPQTSGDMLDYKGQSRLTPAAALADLYEERARPLDAEQQRILDGLERFLRAGIISAV